MRDILGVVLWICLAGIMVACPMVGAIVGFFMLLKALLG